MCRCYYCVYVKNPETKSVLEAQVLLSESLFCIFILFYYADTNNSSKTIYLMFKNPSEHRGGQMQWK